jgi:hypothetical protein
MPARYQRWRRAQRLAVRGAAAVSDHADEGGGDGGEDRGGERADADDEQEFEYHTDYFCNTRATETTHLAPGSR